MNPDTNKFEYLKEIAETFEEGTVIIPNKLLRPDGTEVPKHWTTFHIGEDVVIKNYTFRVAYIGETSILFEPVGPLTISPEDTT